MIPKIMIVTGEASGDLHGANLLRSLQARIPEIKACGMGGNELSSLDMEILFDAERVSVVGIVEVFSHLCDIFRAQKILRRRLSSNPPDLLILIDLPDFNLLVAKKAKKLGIPVFYYISPQVWAWRSGRIKTIQNRVDKLGVILPFEEEFWGRHGVDAEYVGHPLLDTVKVTVARKDFCDRHGIAPGSKCIGLLPGSRKREVSSLLPIFLAATRRVQNETSDRLVFLLPQASTITSSDLAESGLHLYQQDLDIRVISEERYNMMASCDAVVAASGTVTLELAILEVPMVVCYKLSPLTYMLAKLLVKLDHFSLPNLIAGYQAVPELLQAEVTPDNIAGELSALLTDAEKLSAMKKSLREVKEKLGDAGASDKAAAVAIQLLRQEDDGQR